MSEPFHCCPNCRRKMEASNAEVGIFYCWQCCLILDITGPDGPEIISIFEESER